jgi:hypothetical protein
MLDEWERQYRHVSIFDICSCHFRGRIGFLGVMDDLVNSRGVLMIP